MSRTIRYGELLLGIEGAALFRNLLGDDDFAQQRIDAMRELAARVRRRAVVVRDRVSRARRRRRIHGVGADLRLDRQRADPGRGAVGRVGDPRPPDRDGARRRVRHRPPRRMARRRRARTSPGSMRRRRCSTIARERVPAATSRSVTSRIFRSRRQLRLRDLRARARAPAGSRAGDRARSHARCGPAGASCSPTRTRRSC